MKYFFFFVLVYLFSVNLIFSEVSGNISWQGILQDSQGNPVAGTYNLTLKLFNTETNGTALWSELQQNVIISNGLVNLSLGSVNQINLPFNEQYWLEITVGSGTPLSRILMTTVPYSLYSQRFSNVIKGDSLVFKDASDVNTMVINSNTETYLNLSNTTELRINSTAGTEGDILVSRGTGLSPVWLNTISNLTIDNLTVNNLASIDKLSVTKNASVGIDLFVGRNVSVDGTINVGKDVNLNTAIGSYTTTVGILDVIKGAVVEEELGVVGEFLAMSNATVGENLDVIGSGKFGDGISVTGNGVFSGNVNALTGNVNAIKGQFIGDVSGSNATFSGNVYALTGNINAVKGQFAGDVSGANATFSGNVSAIKGQFAGDVSGVNATFSGNEMVNGAFSNISNSTELRMNGSAGAVGSLLVSRGSGLSPQWTNSIPNFTIDNLTVNDLAATDKLSVTKNASIGIDFSVGRNVNVDGTINVGKDVNLNTAIGSYTTTIGILDVIKGAVVEEDLGVVGEFLAMSNATVGENFDVFGDASVSGNLNANGAATLGSSLGVTGAVTLNNTLEVKGANVKLSNGTNFKTYHSGMSSPNEGDAGDILVSRGITGSPEWTNSINQLDILGTLTTTDFLVNNNAVINYDITVDGNSYLNQDVFIGNNLDVTSDAIIGNDLVVAANTYVMGDFYVSGYKDFRIDYPDDPEKKYLYHSCIESDEVLNQYSGNITTDENGIATVKLSDYIEKINIDFRYQLTVIGQFAQAIISKKIQNNQFEIKTDKPNVEVSWQISAKRNDIYAKKNPFQAVRAKGEPTRAELLLKNKAVK
jgi:carbonic anhydrase/acetyltransferase-like protein (isoleucine patch superfamily)